MCCYDVIIATPLILNFSFLFRCLSVFTKLTKNKISSGVEIHVIFLTVTCILIHYTFTELYILEPFRSFNQFSATYQLGSNFIVRHISFLRLISSVWTFPFVISVICGISALLFLPVVYTWTFSFIISLYCGISALLGHFRSCYQFSAASQLCFFFLL